MTESNWRNATRQPTAEETARYAILRAPLPAVRTLAPAVRWAGAPTYDSYGQRAPRAWSNDNAVSHIIT